MADYEQLPPDKEEEDQHRCSCKVVTGFVVVISLIGAAAYVGLLHQREVADLWQQFLLWCKSLGWKAALVVTLATWLATAFGLPASAFFVGSAAIFTSLYGPNQGAAVAITSCGLGFWSGCVSAFALARHLLKGMLDKKLQEFEAMRAVNIIVEEEGWRFAFLMRLSPFMPVEVFNFACALTSMSFAQNALACLGSLPTASFEIWMYCQVAHAAMRAHGSQEAEKGGNNIWIMVAVNVPICILLVLVVRHANKKYHEKVDKFPAEETKETLKSRRTVHRELKKASTMAMAGKKIGTSQAMSYTARSLALSKTKSIIGSKSPGSRSAMALTSRGSELNMGRSKSDRC